MNSFNEYQTYKKELSKIAQETAQQMSPEEAQRMVEALLGQIRAGIPEKESWLSDLLPEAKDFAGDVLAQVQNALSWMWEKLKAGGSDVAYELALVLASWSGKEGEIAKRLRGETEEAQMSKAIADLWVYMKNASLQFVNVYGDKVPSFLTGQANILSRFMPAAPEAHLFFGNADPNQILKAYIGDREEAIDVIEQMAQPGSDLQKYFSRIKQSIRWYKDRIIALAQNFRQERAYLKEKMERARVLERQIFIESQQKKMREIQEGLKEQYGVTKFSPADDPEGRSMILYNRGKMKRQQPKDSPEDWTLGYVYIPRRGWSQNPVWVHNSLKL